ncbi:MAG: hypothetical protein HC772_04555 [Leptolyngbyaceae cyanobacterium CRU_2_3]|nr:hypothetical protein [Leptolyngbyaceae cyanobacterium CRU_2_3]
MGLEAQLAEQVGGSGEIETQGLGAWSCHQRQLANQARSKLPKLLEVRGGVVVRVGSAICLHTCRISRIWVSLKRFCCGFELEGEFKFELDGKAAIAVGLVVAGLVVAEPVAGGFRVRDATENSGRVAITPPKMPVAIAIRGKSDEMTMLFAKHRGGKNQCGCQRY